ncbi:MAG: SHOCT domain-containing protein [Thermoleophilia bacterium]
MTLAMQAFLTLVAWGVFLVWRSTRYPDAADARQRSAARQSPEEILAERLARGEIDPNEYRARLEVLRSSGP